MSGRGITIRIDRLQAIRILGEIMRTKTQEFAREKAAYPKKFEKMKKLVVAEAQRILGQVEAASTAEQLNKIASRYVIDYKKQNELIAYPPVLNLCREKQLLLMLQNDVRKVIPINSNHELWALIKGSASR